MMEGLSFISEGSAEGLVVIGDVGGIGKKIGNLIGAVVALSCQCSHSRLFVSYLANFR